MLAEHHKEDLFRLVLRLAGGVGFLGQGGAFMHSHEPAFLAAGFLLSGAFVILGVLTRLSAAIALIVFTQYAVRANGWEDLIYAPIFFCVLVSGPGRYSFDERFMGERS
jgi:uncharacterized membrane protein YphA (DoxX/SURF4 family)